MKLNSKQREQAEQLLADYRSVTEALSHLGKKEWSCAINLTGNNNDFVDVSLNDGIAREALTAQKKRITVDLANLGIETD